ncbi:MAG: BLUF domain-containing protein [Bacteroidota bacterium]
MKTPTLLMVYYTIYTSRPRQPMSKKLLDEITEVSNKNNVPRNVTGMLLALENRYLQYLEGDELEVEELFEKIKNDGRHHEVMRWVKGFTSEPVFKGWSMGSWMLSNDEIESLTAVKDLKDFIDDPQNQTLQSTRFLNMMNELLQTWLAHEPERAARLKS